MDIPYFYFCGNPNKDAEEYVVVITEPINAVCRYTIYKYSC